MAEKTDLELLNELGVEVEAPKKATRTAREERIIAGFEEIQKFVEENGRPPQHGEDRDIFERLYAVRLDRIRQLDECRTLLAEFDHQGLLEGAEEIEAVPDDDMDDAELLAQLGVAGADESDVTKLRHVKPRAEVRAAEEIANRSRCEDFEKFKPLFRAVQDDLDTGRRQTRDFELKAEIRPGAFFVVGGQIAYVAEMGETFTNPQGRRDARLRVIFDNGTESNLLMRSLQRALHKDEAGRRVTEPSAGPLFAGEAEEDDLESGTIYVLRSKSDLPVVREHRDVLHKIGVTGGKIETRIANARKDATFLLADVEIVATYRLFNINRVKLEKLIHRILDPARLDIEIRDRFGNPVEPREWFLVPVPAIDELVARITDGTIGDYVYDPKRAQLAPRD